jgi:predicted alpha/beta-hydrolase family hydrolase
VVNFYERQDFIEVSGAVGRVSCIWAIPPEPISVCVLAHGAGAGMRHPFMPRIAEELAQYRIAVLRYNFPFTEHRRKRPDPPAVATATVSCTIAYARRQFPGIDLFAGGKSFGGRMTSQLIAQRGAGNVQGIVFLGFPLHPPGKPGIDRTDHLRQVQIPMLFLQGTNDALAKIELCTQVFSELPNATLITFPGADHSFNFPRQDIVPLLASHVAKWMTDLSK